MKSSSLYQFFFSAGLFFLYLCCFFLPVSSSAMTISSAGMVLCWLLCREYKKLPQLIRTNRILWPPLLLFAMLFIGLFYSSAGWQESLVIFKKYRELFYFIIVFSFLQTARNNSTGFLSALNARYVLLAGFILATINIFFISLGRSGMVVYIILLVLSAVQRLKPRQTVISLLLVCGLLAGIYHNSENAATRIDAAIRDSPAMEQAHLQQNRRR